MQFNPPKGPSAKPKDEKTQQNQKPGPLKPLRPPIEPLRPLTSPTEMLKPPEPPAEQPLNSGTVYGAPTSLSGAVPSNPYLTTQLEAFSPDTSIVDAIRQVTTTDLSRELSDLVETVKTAQATATSQAASRSSPTLDSRLAEKVQGSYVKLALAAAEINAASAELSRAGATWDSLLQGLNLGVSAWVKLASGEWNGHWWSDEIGYAHVNDKWGLTLRQRKGRYDQPDELDDEKTWLFGQAPRALRVVGITRLPDLLDALLKQTEEAARKITKESEKALALANVLDPGKQVAERKK